MLQHSAKYANIWPADTYHAQTEDTRLSQRNRASLVFLQCVCVCVCVCVFVVQVFSTRRLARSRTTNAQTSFTVSDRSDPLELKSSEFT